MLLLCWMTLDECAYEALGLENQGLEVQCSRLSSFHPKRVVFRYKIAKRMKRIRERLEEIAEERTKFHFIETTLERRTGVLEWRQTTSYITQPQVYGRENDVDKIVDFLVGNASNLEDLSVHPIVGLGGLGKTTLAQLIFNHERIATHFELTIWVCVSEDFSLKRMTKAIIEAASGSACGDLDLEPLQRKLQDVLQRKRYLLVLDDVWDDEQENWQKLKSVLACGAKGTSILVTTRLTKVAAIMGTVPPYELSMLSNDDCWELFKHRAFAPDEIEQEKLVAIGKEIVKKCGGVPLAAKALGGLLRFKREEKEWIYIKESSTWSFPDNEHSVMSALRLSYLNLPIKLRQCFAYCAIFPKDKIISKKCLIDLWMANGFISSNEILDVEDVGDSVLNELCWRSFFQDIEIDQFGKVTCFKMHDLVHDLAQLVAEDVCCITYDNIVTTLPGRIHHLSTRRRRMGASEKANSVQLHQLKSLRTFTCEGGSSDQLSSCVLKCCSLRVLKTKTLPSSFGHFKHLRFLNLPRGRFQTLPESLRKLWNLQILNLDYCIFLKKLPNSLLCLKYLQQLSLQSCESLSSLPPQIGKLNSLRILSRYVVGKKIGSFLAELGGLKLKGDLHIKHLENVKNVKDAQEANMSSKQLDRLFLSWGENDESELQENAEQILEVLKPHTQQLQTLTVVGYKGAYFPQWMSSPSLKYLTEVCLVDCKSCVQLPLFGKLPSLKRVSIYKMTQVIYLYEESYDGVIFMSLELMLLEELPNLISLCREDGEIMFPRLSTLQITECPKLLGLPSLPSIKNLKIEGKSNQDLPSSIRKLSSLENLELADIEELTCFPDGMLQNLTSLKTLVLYKLPKLEALQNMSAFRKLGLRDLPSLKSLPECCGSLHVLTISNCLKVRYLPTRLDSLERLRIGACPELAERCRKETGQDWPKMAHIPFILIEEKEIYHLP
ncbi:hypothetical protein Fmac_016297 [Flemingia macrophylla]|uniref:NB-ARC domain-containing protein n=1 Tax=Flemingia macrophylla TaxID=520843 RepID=A0ABD1MGZ9_9FABA